MAKYIATVALILSCSLSLFAAQPIAVLTAGSDVTVNGKAVQTTGAPNWPLAEGDEVITGTANAVLSFSDGSQLTMRPHTKLVIRTCDWCVVRLFYGAVDYATPNGSKLEICALGHPIQPPAGTQGSIIIETVPEKRVVWKTATEDRVVSSGKCPCHLGGIPWGKIVIITGAGVAGAAVVEDVTRPDNRSRP